MTFQSLQLCVSRSFASAGEPLVLVWTFHHSLLDGRSIAFILREAFTLYRARVCHDTNSLPLPKSFRQHIEWLRNLDLLRAESYWRNALKGFRAPPRLWLERSEKSQQSADPAFGACEIELEPEETNALNIAASVAGVTMNTILQGAWAMLLSRLSGERDVVFGATRACRRSGVTDADEIVGPLINTVPVRVDVDLEAELGTWLQSIRASSLAVREFEHTPLVKVQSWSEVTRISPLFESIVVYEHLTLDASLHFLRNEWQHLKFQYIGQTNYPLALDRLRWHASSASD